jgi:Outer membrane protein beta-barrel domain
MLKKLTKIILLSICPIFFCFADEPTFSQHFFYVGGMTGYANVDWSSVVASDTLTTLNGSNPNSADGTGVLFGADAGYQFSPHFAIEAEYIKLPNTQLIFLGNMYNGQVSVTSHMYFGAVTLKVIAPLPSSKFSLFADAGPAYQYRVDSIASIGTWAPTFGSGLLYRINGHWQAEGAFQYAPGTGKSISDPMTAYIPEIYAGTFKIDYIF